jgi:TonB family protein
MPDTSLHSADRLETPERRRHARQRVDALCAVTLGQDNGGIVLNISEGGLHVQAVAPLGPAETVLELRFGLPKSSEQFRVNGQVVWVGRSRKEAGISLLDLSEEARNTVKSWIEQQTPAADAASPTEQPLSEKEKHILAMPPANGYRSRPKHAPPTHRMSREELDSLFPSEKVFLPGREAKPTPVPEAGSRARAETATSIKDWVSGIEERAKEAREKFSSVAEPDRPASESAPPSAGIPRLAPTDADEHSLPPANSDHSALPEISGTAFVAEPASEVGTVPAYPEFLVAVAALVDPDAETDQQSAIIDIPLEPQSAMGRIPAAPALEGLTARESWTKSFEPSPRAITEPAGEIRAEVKTKKPTLEILRAPDPAESLPSAPAPIDSPAGPQTSSASSTTQNLPTVALGPISDLPAVAHAGDAGESSSDIIADLRASFAKTSNPPRREFAQQRWEAQRRSQPTPAEHDNAKPSATVTPPPVARQETIPPPAPAAPEATISSDRTAADVPKFEVFSKTDPAPLTSKAPKNPIARKSSFADIFQQRMGVTLGQAGMLVLAAAIVLATGLSLERRAIYGPSLDTTATGNIAAMTSVAPSNAANTPGSDRRLPIGRSSASKPQNATTNAADNSARARNESAAVATMEKKADAAPSETSATVPSTQDHPEQTEPAEQSNAATTAAVAVALSKTAPVPVPTASSAAPATTSGSSMPITAPGDRVIPASLSYRVEPVYPADAQQKHLEGTVKLNAVIGRDGQVMGLGVVSGPAALVQAALTAAREWRYVPALLNGAPVETQAEITIEFKLPASGER